MKRRIVLVSVAVAAVGITLILLPTTPVPLPSPTEIGDTGIDVIATGLRVPWAIDFATDGRMFVTERIGNVRVVVDGKLVDEPIFTKEVARVGEAGMLGLALDPDFENNHFIYVYYTYVDDNGNLWNRVVRLIEDVGKVYEEKILIDKIPGAAIHDGGRIKFGPDGKLYVTTGDAAEPGLAQDLKSLAGKILRINADGSIPDDNPFSNSPIYSYGHRNPQGIAWHPITGEMYVTEHGPAGNDEINLIKPGLNYGWPIEQCVAKEFVGPLMCYEVAIAPAGATFYSSNVLPYRNDLFFATLRGAHVEHVIFSGKEIRAENFLDGFGRIRDIVEGPDGYLYVATSNRDGRGIPAIDDDKILRISRTR
ncbi:MAG: PQQ-dependent sugar dehydrogenase [Nitrososphaerales archaeon]